MQRGDVDWGMRARGVLPHVQCVHLLESGEDSVYLCHAGESLTREGASRHPVLIVLYADEFPMGVNRVATASIHYALRELLGFSVSHIGYRLKQFVGLELYDVEDMADGIRR